MLRQDMELGGVRLKRGDQIVAMLVAANLDPAANMHPEKLLLVLLVLILGALLVVGPWPGATKRGFENWHRRDKP
jgi:hypothetical protein